MAPRFSIWMVLAGVAVGVLGGYLAGSGVMDKRLSVADSPQKSGTLRDGRRAGTVAGMRGADRELLREALAGRDLADMSFEEIVARMEELFADATTRGMSSADMHESGHKLHVLSAALPQDHVLPLLDVLLDHPVMNPSNETVALGLVESLLGRLVAYDLSVAVAWATERRHRAIEIIAGIVGETDPEGALALLGREGCKLDSWRHTAVIEHLVAGGPKTLLAARELFPQGKVSNAFTSIPANRCRVFADAWRERFEAGESDWLELGEILDHWAGLDPEAMVQWYWAHAPEEMRGDENAVYGLMESLLRKHPDTGLEFAEHEFARSPQVASRVFLFAINSGTDPELWDDLAERLPPGVLPTSSQHFVEHFDIGPGPGPKRIAAAAQCLPDAGDRRAYLRAVLGKAAEGGWSPVQYPAAEIAKAREDLNGLPLGAEDREEILRLFERAAEKWARPHEDPVGF